MLIEGYEIDKTNLPVHIGIIMDGNGRWAETKRMPKVAGHKKGVDALRKVLNFAYDVLNLEIISLYAFSIENWKRSQNEVTNLMKLFSLFYRREFKEIKKRKVKVIHSGITDKLPDKTIKLLNKMQEETKDFDKGIVNLAFNYGGRNEIIEATKKILAETKNNKFDINDLNEETFKNFLFNPDIPDPDLIIRTSGELRMSNFLLWESAYSELYFCDTLWPDFGPSDLVKAIYDYQKRERRYGGR